MHYCSLFDNDIIMIFLCEKNKLLVCILIQKGWLLNKNANKNDFTNAFILKFTRLNRSRFNTFSLDDVLMAIPLIFMNVLKSWLNE